MPHDANGHLLSVGDMVMIPVKITQICLTEDFCNCIVEFVHPMPPDGSRQTISQINTRQVEKKV